MKKHKVIIRFAWWTPNRLAKRTEDEINRYSLEGREVDSVQYGYWGYSTMIVLKKTID